jgi:hypothetical protein
MAITGPETSSIALIAASRGGNPCSMWCSTASTTTIASSTTKPMARTSPRSDSVLNREPQQRKQRKCADQRYWDSAQWNQCGTPALEENENDDDYEVRTPACLYGPSTLIDFRSRRTPPPRSNEEQPGYIGLAFRWRLDINTVAGPIRAELVVLASVNHELYRHPIGRVRLHFRRSTPRYVSSRGSARASCEC